MPGRASAAPRVAAGSAPAATGSAPSATGSAPSAGGSEAAGLAERIDARLRAAARPERAEQERAYLKSSLVHYGTSVPAIRAAVRAERRSHPDLGPDQVRELADLLWTAPAAAPVHERRMAAVEVLDAYVDRMDAGDLDLVEAYVRQARTWALVDGLAASVAGVIVERCGDDPRVGATLDRWVAADDFWVRRAALLAHLPGLRAGGGDPDRFLRYADSLLDEREFFVRKAIGWVLRDTGRRRPDLVADWLLPRAGRASTVTWREAVKPLSAEQRARLAAARADAGMTTRGRRRPRGEEGT